MFKRNKQVDEPTPLFENSEPEVANYVSALNYLIALSDDDYKKITKVANIHRNAYEQAAKVLGEENVPTTFIHPPEDETDAELDAMLLDPDEPKLNIDKKEKPKK